MVMQKGTTWVVSLAPFPLVTALVQVRRVANPCTLQTSPKLQSSRAETEVNQLVKTIVVSSEPQAMGADDEAGAVPRHFFSCSPLLCRPPVIPHSTLSPSPLVNSSSFSLLPSL